MKTDSAATVFCPLKGATLDVERCAACQYRSDRGVTCNGDDRREARDIRWLLTRLPI